MNGKEADNITGKTKRRPHLRFKGAFPPHIWGKCITRSLILPSRRGVKWLKIIRGLCYMVVCLFRHIKTRRRLQLRSMAAKRGGNGVRKNAIMTPVRSKKGCCWTGNELSVTNASQSAYPCLAQHRSHPPCRTRLAWAVINLSWLVIPFATLIDVIFPLWRLILLIAGKRKLGEINKYEE